MFSITGYFFFGSKFDGRTMIPQMSVVPSRALDTSTFGARHPAFASSVVSACWSSMITCASFVRPNWETGARPGVDVVRVVGREGDGVVAVGVGERREPAAVEVDPVVLQEIRILLRIHASRPEHDLFVGLVHALHAAYEPVPFRDLVLDRAGGAVHEIKVRPAVALRHPDELLAVIEIEAVLAPRIGKPDVRTAIVHERL